MELRVIIPVKPFGEAKQRLAAALNPEERARLAQSMFRHVFGVALGVFGASNVLVVSRSQAVLAIAQMEGALSLREHAASDLNPALSQAAQFVSAQGVFRVLILASDLPLLGDDDVAQMRSHACAIAPDRHKRGTNALLWPAHLPVQFGQDSFARHLAIAQSAGAYPQVVNRPGLAHDVDWPEDLINGRP